MGFVGGGDGGIGSGRRRERRILVVWVGGVGFFVDVVEVNRGVLVVFCHPPPFQKAHQQIEKWLPPEENEINNQLCVGICDSHFLLKNKTTTLGLRILVGFQYLMKDKAQYKPNIKITVGSCYWQCNNF